MKPAERKGVRMHDARNRSDVADLLALRRLRATAARRAVLASILASRKHPTVDEIFERLRRSGTPVSIATLYQNLAALVAAGLLRRFAGPDGVARYDHNLEAHNHIVCERCGRIADVNMQAAAGAQSVMEWRRQRPLAGGWLVRAMEVEFRGTCPQCRRRAGQRP